MAIDVSYRDGFSTSAQDLSRFNKNFLINEGVANDGLKVSQSTVPAMSVQVSVGTAYFYGTGTTADTMFEFYSDAIETVTIPTAAAQARIDIVCAKIDASTGVASLVVVSGTPSGSPAVPATPASHYKLANIAVGASVTTITNANITDTRRTMFMVPTGARNQGLINGYIIPSVASNNLTVAISTSPTSVVAPTATNPVFVWINGVLRPITSALSITRNAGTNWFNSGSAELATKEIDYFVYMGFNATDGVTLGFSRIPYARLYSDFSATTTNEKHCAISTITNAVAGDNYVNVGRFAATLSASASFNWSVPTFNNANLIQEPIYETRWLTWTPDYTQTGGMTFTSVTTTEANYKVLNRYVELNFRFDGTTGAAADAQIEFTVPFIPSTVTVNFAGSGFDGGSIGILFRIESGRQLGAQKFTGSVANWSIGSAKYVNGTGNYLI
jgi:hypothetical protein